MSAFNFLLLPSVKKIYSKQCCSRRYQIAWWQSFKELLFGLGIHGFLYQTLLFKRRKRKFLHRAAHWKATPPPIVQQCTIGTSLIRVSLNRVTAVANALQKQMEVTHTATHKHTCRHKSTPAQKNAVPSYNRLTFKSRYFACIQKKSEICNNLPFDYQTIYSKCYEKDSRARKGWHIPTVVSSASMC